MCAIPDTRMKIQMNNDAKGVHKYLDSAISALKEVHAEIKSTKNSKQALEEEKAVR